MSTVVVASSQHLGAFTNRDDFGDAQVFSDAEALRALDVITRERPSLIALERLFAATSRGAALINRIKADPALAGCEIRIVNHDGPVAPPAPPGLPATGPADAAAGEGAAPSAAAPLDQRGTRRTARTRVSGSVEVLIDGNSAALVDVSVSGIQVLSASILKPNQRIRVTLPVPGRPVRVSAGVVWASFEMPKEGARYRAGIEFLEVAPPATGRWIATLGVLAV